MAEVRARLSCADAGCSSIEPSVDIEYEDVWTDEATAGRPKDEPFAYAYADLATPPPVSLNCMQQWSASCRIVINYETHIHPLWAASRPVLDDMGNPINRTIISGGGVGEVILATSPTVEGEATALYLARLLKPLGVRVTRIAMGIPVGSDLEYADEVTMTRAMEGRRDL